VQKRGSQLRGKSGARAGSIVMRQLLASAIAVFALVCGDASAGSEVSLGWAEVSAVFAERCVMCHSAIAGASRGLRLDDYDAALIGSERGLVLIPGKAAESELIRRLRGQSVPRVPFLSRPLPEEEIALIEGWIAAGLPKQGEKK